MEERNCTFKPKTDESKVSYKKQQQVTGPSYISEFSKDGFVDHFTRIEMARKNKSYRDLGEKKHNLSSNNPENSRIQGNNTYTSFYRNTCEEGKFVFSKEEAARTMPMEGKAKKSEVEKVESEGNQRASVGNILENLKKMAKMV